MQGSPSVGLTSVNTTPIPLASLSLRYSFEMHRIPSKSGKFLSNFLCVSSARPTPKNCAAPCCAVQDRMPLSSSFLPVIPINPLPRLIVPGLQFSSFAALSPCSHRASLKISTLRSNVLLSLHSEDSHPSQRPDACMRQKQLIMLCISA